MSHEPAIKKNDLVEYDGEIYRVVRRREVTPLAMLRTCDFEVKLESLNGEVFGYVAENEVEKISGEESNS